MAAHCVASPASAGVAATIDPSAYNSGLSPAASAVHSAKSLRPSLLAEPATRGSASPATQPEISVVVPVHDEADNVAPLYEEIRAALEGSLRFEAVFVDDASGDDTPARLRAIAARDPRLRVIHHRANCGQSAAILTGVRHARAPLIATLDGDRQNDPADIPRLWHAWRGCRHDGPVLVAGQRTRRQDTWVRRMSSRIANGVRGRILGDGTPDTGCGLKVFARDDFLALPWFDHVHRFLPALFRRAGGEVLLVPVHHRPRPTGRSHYGIHNRLWTGLVDLLGVAWLQRRARLPRAREFDPSKEH
jgi:dolichol-phosphate mannosyltransferase